MKKLTAVIISIFMLFTLAYAEKDKNEITVKINGEVLNSPISARLVNDRTMLPMRSVFEALGATVEWFEEDQVIFATKDDFFVMLQIGSPKMLVQAVNESENKTVELDSPPFIEGDYTLVPVRAAAEALKAKVEWNDAEQTVEIFK